MRTGVTEFGLGAAVDIYARTEHTVGWVKLNAGTQLVADAQKLDFLEGSEPSASASREAGF